MAHTTCFRVGECVKTTQAKSLCVCRFIPNQISLILCSYRGGKEGAKVYWLLADAQHGTIILVLVY